MTVPDLDSGLPDKTQTSVAARLIVAHAWDITDRSFKLLLWILLIAGLLALHRKTGSPELVVAAGALSTLWIVALVACLMDCCRALAAARGATPGAGSREREALLILLPLMLIGWATFGIALPFLIEQLAAGLVTPGVAR